MVEVISMSVSSESKAIPRRMYISDPSQIPHDYSSTPGGTLYSTTPGGTKIVYDRSFLLNLRNSPISQTPPKCSIPTELVRGLPHAFSRTNGTNRPSHVITTDETAEQFPMEI